MAINVITPEDLEIFKKELLQAISKLLTERLAPTPKRWLKSHQVLRLLAVSPGTLQHLRINGTLPFIKVGRVIFYDAADIEKMLLKRKQNTDDETEIEKLH